MIRMTKPQRLSLVGLTRSWIGDAEITWVPETKVVNVRRVDDDRLWAIAGNGAITRLR